MAASLFGTHGSPSPSSVSYLSSKFSQAHFFQSSKVNLLFQALVDHRYEVVKMAEMQPCAEELPKEKQIVKFVAQIEKSILSSEDAISKRFDVVTDCLDHHFVKENGHESVMHLLKLSLSFVFRTIVIGGKGELCVIMVIFYI